MITIFSQMGASDYLIKGVDFADLLLAVQWALEMSAMYRQLRQLRRECSDNYHFSYIVGYSERMREVFDLVARVAKSETASVLINLIKAA